MTEPHGTEDRLDLGELAGYLEGLQFGVDAHVSEARLVWLRVQALQAIAPILDDPAIHGFRADIADGAVATPLAPSHPMAASPDAQTSGVWPSGPPPLPVPPPLPIPPIPLPPTPSPLPMPPLPTEPVPSPPSATPAWREPEEGGRDAGSRGVSKRQR